MIILNDGKPTTYPKNIMEISEPGFLDEVIIDDVRSTPAENPVYDEFISDGKHTVILFRRFTNFKNDQNREDKIRRLNEVHKNYQKFLPFTKGKGPECTNLPMVYSKEDVNDLTRIQLIRYLQGYEISYKRGTKKARLVYLLTTFLSENLWDTNYVYST